MLRSMSALACLVSATAVTAAPVPGPKAPDYKALKEESVKKWGGAELLLVAKFEGVTPGPVGLSDPPVRNYRLQLAPSKVLRGSLKAEKTLPAFYSIRSKDAPTFPAPEKDAVVALKFVRGAWEVQGYEEETKEALEQATLATSFPLGWTIKDGKLVSPWDALKPGRPVLLVGEAVKFSVAPVPPKVEVKFGNPDGDGEYKLSFTNESDKEVEVPALLTDGKAIRWKECVVIRCQDKTYPIPGATGAVGELNSVVLKPKETVSGTVHALSLDGPMWPMGGYRIEFQFCVGEKSATQSFYYLSKHHDPIRDAAQKEAKK